MSRNREETAFCKLSKTSACKQCAHHRKVTHMFRFRFVSLMVIMAVCAIFTATVQPSQAHRRRSGAVINLGPIQPSSLGWGQTGLFNAYVSQNGRPVKRVSVEFWFSGRHGIQTNHWYITTDQNGRASFTATIPRDWRSYDTWVDLNAACTSVGAYNIWRVKNK